MRTALLVVFLLTKPYWAASVYKCKGPNGEVTFTNIKCPEKSETQHYSNYQRAQDAPDPSLYNQPQRTSEDTSFTTEVAPVAPVTQTPRVVGYQCSVEGRAWIQTSHCPPSTIRHVDGDVSGYHHQSGTPLHGTVSIPVSVKIDETPLDREAMCQHLAANARTAEKGPDADSSYMRNRMRETNNCR